MYGKYFASTFTGSMVGAGSTVFAVWGYVIANCRSGIIELNPRLLAMVLGDTPEAVNKAVDFLCAPDPESRSKEHDGCRMISKGAFLYDVPNHSTYRKMLNEDERRAYFREKKREQRQKTKALTLDSPRRVQDMSTVSTHSESESEGEDPIPSPPTPSVPELPPKSPPASPAVRKAKDNLPTTPEALRVAGMFGRRPTSKWSDSEVKKFKKLCPFDPEDLALVERYYAAEKSNDDSILRRSLEVFLNNFPGEVDRARMWQAEQKPAASSLTPIRRDPPGWREWLKAAHPGEKMPEHYDYMMPDLRDEYRKAHPILKP